MATPGKELWSEGPGSDESRKVSNLEIATNKICQPIHQILDWFPDLKVTVQDTEGYSQIFWYQDKSL